MISWWQETMPGISPTMFVPMTLRQQREHRELLSAAMLRHTLKDSLKTAPEH